MNDAAHEAKQSDKTKLTYFLKYECLYFIIIDLYKNIK